MSILAAICENNCTIGDGIVVIGIALSIAAFLRFI